jgi:hypothetical protein
LSAASDITINAAINATKGGLTLDAGGAIAANAAVKVGTFTLQNGAWSQVGANIAAFSAGDFRIVAGSFLRALGGDGTSANPYQITDVYGLQGIGSSATLLTKNYALANDIDASGTAGWNGGAGFDPIGNGVAFAGSLSGEDRSIAGLYIRSASANVGLFGYVGSGGTIENVQIINADIIATSGAQNVGAVSGSSDGLLSNVFGSGLISTAVVPGSENMLTVGGLVGLSGIYSRINNSSSDVNIIYSGNNRYGSVIVGGLVGLNAFGGVSSSSRGEINNSHSSGSIINQNGSLYVDMGGLVGVNFGVIADSHSTVLVNAGSSDWNSLGGFVGRNIGSIDRSYSLGSVIASGGANHLGGFVGANFSGNISRSYSSGDVQGVGSHSYIGGFAGESVDGGINWSYSLGRVKSVGDSNAIGGFVGSNGRAGFGAGNIAESYSSGEMVVDGVSNNIGGFAGVNNGTISASFWDAGQAPAAVVGVGYGNASGVAGITTEQARNLNAYSAAGWNFSESGNWFMIDGQTRPFLRSEWSTTVTNAHQLQLMAMNLGANYTLAKNIDLGPEWNNVANMWGTGGFVPIGNDSGSFTGSFNGADRVIKNIYISRTGENTGLFGVVGSTGTISNITLDSGTISGSWFVGALAGMTYGNITNAHASTSVSGGADVGGLVGQLRNATISDSSSSGDVVSSGGAGGLAGLISSATLTRSFATGSVTGGSYAGGLVGISAGNVTHSYATGDVSGGDRVGGLVGDSRGGIAQSYASGNVVGNNEVGGLVGNSGNSVNSIGWIAQSYATGTVTGQTSVGGLVGVAGGFVSESYATGAVTGVNMVGGAVGNSYGGTNVFPTVYWNRETSGQHQSAGSPDAAGLTSAQMKAKSNFVGWDFSDTGAWFMVDGYTAPKLKYASATVIDSLAELQAISNDLYGIYRLAGNIDASATASWNSGAGFIPIGSTVNPFQGWFDGGGKVISGLTIVSNAANVGLFGVVGERGIVSDVTLANVSITATGGSQNVGTIAGANLGLIANVSASGSVGNLASVIGDGRIEGGYGGLVGRNEAGGIVAGSSANVAVTARGPSSGFLDAGGLVGINSGEIAKSFATGAVTGTSPAADPSDHIYVGGLVGWNYGGSVTESYASGAVTSAGFNGRAGGLVAVNDGGDISYAYALGSVTANGDQSIAGGFVGENKNFGTITQAYASGAVKSSGVDSFAGGFAGANSEHYSEAFFQSPSQLITRSFWDKDTTGQANGVGDDAGGEYLTGLTGSQARAQSSYRNTSQEWSWDFGENGRWFMVDGWTRPLLRSEWSQTITNAHQLQLMAMRPGEFYTLASDINFGTTFTSASDIWSNKGFASIGSSAYGTFTGGFDGNDFHIDGLKIDSGATYVGLFGISSGTIADVHLTNVDINSNYAGTGGYAHVGALVGFNSGSVSGSSAQGRVSAHAVSVGANAGGLVGTNSGTISHSSATVNVSASGTGQRAWIGGLVGQNYSSGTISNASASGTVNGVAAGSSVFAGGLVGYNSAGVITGSQSDATVTVGDWAYAGGLVGYNSGTITNGTGSGPVTAGANSRAGGLAGYSSGLITGSQAWGAVAAGAWSRVGGLVGDNTGSIWNGAAHGRVNGGDNSKVGGLVGFNDGEILTSQAHGAVTAGAWSRAGGLVGVNDGTIAGDPTFVLGFVPDGVAPPCAAGQACATGTVTVGLNGIGGGLAGENSGAIERAFATGHVYGAAGSDGGPTAVATTILGGLVGINRGSLSEVLASGTVGGIDVNGVTAGNLVAGGLVGDNSGWIEHAYVYGDVRGGNSSTVGGLVGRHVPKSEPGCGEDCASLTVREGPGFGVDRAAAFGNVRAGNSSYAGGAFGYIDGSPFAADTGISSVWASRDVQAGDFSYAGGLAGMVGAYGSVASLSTNGQVTVGAGGFAGGFVGRSLGSLTDVSSSGTVVGGAGATVGGLAGYASGTIDNASASGPVRGGNGSIVGGLIGENRAALSNVHASGAVAGGDGSLVGGLVGHHWLNTITGAWATGAVTGGAGGAAGGLVGVNEAGIASSWASGAVTAGANAAVGGLVGYNGGTIATSRASGNVAAGAGGIAGGLVGENDGTITGNSSFVAGADPSLDLPCVAGQTCASGSVTVGGNGFAGGLVGLNGHIIDSAYATGSVFGAAGSANGVNTEIATVIGGLVGGNTGSVSNALAFGNVSGLLTGGVRAGGLVAGGLVGGNTGAIDNAYAFGSVAAGDSSIVGGLVGASLPGIFLCGECGAFAGLGGMGDASIAFAAAFGNVSAGSNSFVGGAVGYVNGFVASETPSLAFVNAYGSVAADAGSAVGGIAGVIDSRAYVRSVSAFGDVSVAGANSQAGGVAGYNGGLLAAAVANGSVNASGAANSVGGLVGRNDGIITAISYATGNVTASGSASYVGGLVGANAGRIENSGATGNVAASGSNSAVGGVVGWNDVDGTLADTHYIAAAGNGVYGVSNSSIGGLVGINRGAITGFEVDPPVVGTGSNNSVGGAVGENSGTLQDGTIVADVSGGSGSAVGLVTGVNSGSVSGVSSSGTVNGVDPNATPNNPDNPPPSNPPANDPPPINPTQYTPPPDPDQNKFVLQTSDPTPSQGQGGAGGSGQGGQGGGQGGQGGGNGGAAGNNNPPPPPSGPPPGPGIGRTVHEQRYSGVPPVNETRFLPGEVVVQVANTVPAARIQEVARALGITLVASQAIDGSGRVVYRFSTGNGKNIRDVIRALERQQIVASAQPNYVFGLAQNAAPAPNPGASSGSLQGAGANPPEVETGSLPPTPELSSDLQSDMASRTTGLPAGDAAQYIIDKLRLGIVHSRAVGRNVSVAVIDSEIDVQHPDLVGVISETFDATGTASNPHAHGTGMAGAIASHRRLLGIAPGVKILAVKAFDESNASAEATSFQILKGLDWALTKKPRIINMSFAGPRDLMLERALQKAYEQGIVLIAAAGNAGPKSPPLYPAADVNVIAVSASDYADKPFAMANRGKHIAVAAPGVDVLVPSPKGGYQLTTGTSVAAAHVSGVAALLLESKPTLTPKELRAILTGSAKPVALKGVAEIFGAGLVDPLEALSRLGPRPVSAAPAASAVQ